MNITNLIDSLTTFKKVHGDLEIVVSDDELGCYYNINERHLELINITELEPTFERYNASRNIMIETSDEWLKIPGKIDGYAKFGTMITEENSR